MSPAREVLDAELAGRLATLTLRTRKAVEGLTAGMHRSPHRGASVVFVEHRAYRPGDDPRWLDWKAFARNDRHVVKRFEQESRLRATLVLDGSGSMDWSGAPDRVTKHEYAATILGALAYVLVHQADATALVAFDAEEGPELARIGARRLATGRRRMGRYEAGRAWNQLGLGRQMAQDLEGAERAFRQAVRLLRRCDGPLGVTLAACNLAEVRLRRGRLDGVEAIVAAATVANLRSGIRRAQVHDEALWARLELSRGELEACAARS